MRLLAMVVRRILWMPPTLFGLVLIVFAISHVIPSDPARVMAGENAPAEQVEALRHKYGLDLPLPQQFMRYVGDVATAVADAVDGKTKQGAIYELGGPEVLTMREIMDIILATIERRRMLVSLPFGLAKLQALFLQFAPGPLKLTPDQVALLRSDNVVSDAAKAAGLTLEALGIVPDSLEAIVPQYLWRFRATGQFQKKNA